VIFASRFLRLMDPYMEGPDVSEVQRRLRELGYRDLAVDGIYGPKTEAAVRQFQTASGLKADGIVGPDTWSMLGFSSQSGVQRLKIGTRELKGYRITVDIIQRKLVLAQVDETIGVYPVAVGKPQTPTPIGDWKIIQKQVDPGGPFGARWMRLSVPFGGYGIHGTDNPPSIGTAASHGCIRMYNEDVIKVYDIVPVGTPVKIMGTVSLGRILSIGITPGADVQLVQTYLQVLGYYKGDIDSFFGPQTQQAVINFQKDQGLAADGIVGPLTYQALQRAYDQATGNRQP